MFYRMGAHEQIAAQQGSEESRKASEEAIGNKTAEYLETTSSLKATWDKASDSAAKRLVDSVLTRPCPAIYHSIMADNLGYFDKHYKTQAAVVSPQKMLEWACLCGAKQIAEHLLKELKANYLSDGYEYLLGYVGSSKNADWAKEIAISMAKQGKKMPQTVYSLAPRSLAQEIIAIFNPPEPSKGAAVSYVPPAYQRPEPT